MPKAFVDDPLFRRIRKHAKERLETAEKDRGVRTKKYKRFLALEDKMLRRYHRKGDSGIRVTRSRSIIIDVLIEHIFKDAVIEATESSKVKEPYTVSVIATGGYGRGELCPHSDIDLLMLYPDSLSSWDYQTKKLTVYGNVYMNTLYGSRPIQNLMPMASQEFMLILILYSDLLNLNMTAMNITSK